LAGVSSFNREVSSGKLVWAGGSVQAPPVKKSGRSASEEFGKLAGRPLPDKSFRANGNG
jgi:hypothetical protein